MLPNYSSDMLPQSRLKLILWYSVESQMLISKSDLSTDCCGGILAKVMRKERQLFVHYVRVERLSGNIPESESGRFSSWYLSWVSIQTKRSFWFMSSLLVRAKLILLSLSKVECIGTNWTNFNDRQQGKLNPSLVSLYCSYGKRVALKQILK